MISMRGVSFGYEPDREVLSGVDLDLHPGLTLLVGPNGCGKSTLLKIAAGVEKPAHGIVTVDGHDMWRDEVAARYHIAYLPEHPDLSPYATVLEILQLVCGLRRRPLNEARDALEWVGLDSLGGRTIRELSKGQRRRATCAAARIGAPGILLLDEPIEGMDRSFREVLVEWITRRVADGATVVIVSHEFESFATLAGRAITVRNGICHEIGPLTEAGERATVIQDLACGVLPGSA